MPTDSPCLLSINTDRECAAHLSCNTQLAWCSHCVITQLISFSLSHTRTTSPLIRARPNCSNMHRWKAKLCWARPQSLRIRWCHFNVLAGSFRCDPRESNRKDTNSSSSWYLPKHNRHKHQTRLSYHSSIAGAERDARAAETLPRCQTHRKCMGGMRGWEARNMRQLLITVASGPMWRTPCWQISPCCLSHCDFRSCAQTAGANMGTYWLYGFPQKTGCFPRKTLHVTLCRGDFTLLWGHSVKWLHL